MNSSISSRRGLCAALAVLVASGGLVAQEGLPAQGKPAPQLKKLAPMVGHWTGKGTATMAPGQPDMSWTSTSQARWVLDGHFIQDDVEIRFPGMPSALKMRSYYGWDRENECYVAIGMGNTGTVEVAKMHWTDDHTTVTASSKMENGVLTVDRWVTKVESDKVSFSGTRLLGSDSPFVHVQGVNVRSEQGSTIDAAATDASAGGVNMFAGAFVAEQMPKLEGMVGKYTFQGSMIMAPGTPEMKISGKETVAMGFDNSVLVMHTIGDPVVGMGDHTYEAYAFMAYDETRQCYLAASVTNMGEVHHSEWRLHDEDTMIGTMAGKMQGKYTVARTTLELDDSGAMTKIISESMAGADKPVVAFRGTYAKQ